MGYVPWLWILLEGGMCWDPVVALYLFGELPIEWGGEMGNFLLIVLLKVQVLNNLMQVTVTGNCLSNVQQDYAIWNFHEMSSVLEIFRWFF